MKQAYQAANPVDAQLAIDLLAAEGITAHLQGQFLSGAAGELPVGELLRVWVADENLPRAKEVLAERSRGEDALASGDLDPLFVRSWSRAWTGLGASGRGLELRDALLAAWDGPHRRYHTLRHLHESLLLFEQQADTALRPAEVEIALWFHDAIYDPRAKDNEERSARWADTALARAGVASEACARVDALVMATRHEALPRTGDEALLVDIDLAILGADEERFDEYEAEVREEYSWVPSAIFRHKRREVLAQFMARPAIYSTPPLHDRLEARARENLQRAYGRLRPWWQFW